MKNSPSTWVLLLVIIAGFLFLYFFPRNQKGTNTIKQPIEYVNNIFNKEREILNTETRVRTDKTSLDSLKAINGRLLSELGRIKGTMSCEDVVSHQDVIITNQGRTIDQASKTIKNLDTLNLQLRGLSTTKDSLITAVYLELEESEGKLVKANKKVKRNRRIAIGATVVAGVATGLHFIP